MYDFPASKSAMVAALACTLGWLPGPTNAEPLSVTGKGVTRDVHCDGEPLEIAGFQHVLTVRGTCESITISGNGNRVDFETAGRLQVQGFQQQVSGGRAGDLEVSGHGNQLDATIGDVAVMPADGDEVEAKGRSRGAPVQIQGVKHVVTLRLELPVRLDVAGAENRIEWQAGPGVPEPRVQIQGLRQTVRRAP